MKVCNRQLDAERLGRPCHPVTDDELELARREELEATSGRLRRFVISGGLARLYAGMCAASILALMSSIVAVDMYGDSAPLVFLFSYAVMILCVVAYDTDKCLDRRALMRLVLARRMTNDAPVGGDDVRDGTTPEPSAARPGREPGDVFAE